MSLNDGLIRIIYHHGLWWIRVIRCGCILSVCQNHKLHNVQNRSLFMTRCSKQPPFDIKQHQYSALKNSRKFNSCPQISDCFGRKKQIPVKCYILSCWISLEMLYKLPKRFFIQRKPIKHTLWPQRYTIVDIIIRFSHSMSQSGWIACFIVVAQNCKLSHLFYMFLANIYSHLRSVYKQELSQRTMRMQTWLATTLSTTM